MPNVLSVDDAWLAQQLRVLLGDGMGGVPVRVVAVSDAAPDLQGVLDAGSVASIAASLDVEAGGFDWSTLGAWALEASDVFEFSSGDALYWATGQMNIFGDAVVFLSAFVEIALEASTAPSGLPPRTRLELFPGGNMNFTVDAPGEFDARANFFRLLNRAGTLGLVMNANAQSGIAQWPVDAPVVGDALRVQSVAGTNIVLHWAP